MFGGGALVAGRFNNTGFDSLAIGVPEESIGQKKSAGAVHVLYGSTPDSPQPATGVARARSRHRRGDQQRMRSSELGLAAANFGTRPPGASSDSLAISVPRGGPHGAGAVHVLHSTGERLTARGSEYWSQASPGVAGQAQRGDEFGLAIASADFGKGPYADLVIGAPSEAIGPWEVFVGQFHVLYGTSRGLS